MKNRPYLMVFAVLVGLIALALVADNYDEIQTFVLRFTSSDVKYSRAWRECEQLMAMLHRMEWATLTEQSREYRIASCVLNRQGK